MRACLPVSGALAFVASAFTISAFAASALAAEPDYPTIKMEIDVAKPAAAVWAKVGGYCDISKWLDVDCMISRRRRHRHRARARRRTRDRDPRRQDRSVVRLHAARAAKGSSTTSITASWKRSP